MIVSGYLFESADCLDGPFSPFSLVFTTVKLFLRTCWSVSALEQYRCLLNEVVWMNRRSSSDIRQGKFSVSQHSECNHEAAHSV